MQIDGLNPKGLATSLTGNSEMNEVLSPVPFTSDLSFAGVFLLPGSSSSPCNLHLFPCVSRDGGHFNPLCEGSEKAWCARRLHAVPKALRLRDAVLFTPRTASWRRAGLAFAIPVSFTAGEDLWWSQRAGWAHHGDAPSQRGTEGDGCGHSFGCRWIRLSGAVPGKQLSLFSVLPLKAGQRQCRHTCAHGQQQGKLKGMAGLTGAICPAFVYWSQCELLSRTVSRCSEVMVRHSHLQQKVGRLICPGRSTTCNGSWEQQPVVALVTCVC